MRSTVATVVAAGSAIVCVTGLAGCSSGAHHAAATGSTGSAATTASQAAALSAASSPAVSSAASGSATASPAAGSNDTSGASGASGPAQADFTFSGSVSGHLDNPVKGPKYACGTPTFPDLWVLNDVEGSLGGTSYELQLSINNFTGHGAQTGNTILTVWKVGSDPSTGFMSVEAPKVSFTDPSSGTFDGDVQQGLDSPAPTLHVTGSFHC